MTDDEELIVHELAIAGTRPALMPFLGIPWKDFCVFFMAGLECFALHHVQLLVVVIIPVFLFSLTLYYRDYNAGRCFLCWLTISFRQLVGAIIGWVISIRPEMRALAAYDIGVTSVSPGIDRSFRGIANG